MRLTDRHRRGRLVARHHLGRTAEDVLAAVRGVVALHSSDPTTPYLALRARLGGFATEHLDRALLEERSLWRLHAMRRTLFVVPADEAPDFLAGAGADVARRERSRLEGWLAADDDPPPGSAWLAEIEARVLETLGPGGELSSKEIADAVPELSSALRVGTGKWSTTVTLGSRLLLVMAMEGRIVRTRPAGSWRSSQYRWAAAGPWFGTPAEPHDPGTARAGLARRYLASHGPATREDVRWWTGWTVRDTDAALRSIGAVTVGLGQGAEGYVLPDDLEAAPEPEGSVTLLPGLDPAAMGWKERGWYLGSHAPRLFDRNGNAGPTVWVDGRVVGGWAQSRDGAVAFRLLEDVGTEGARRVEEEAGDLGDWLGAVTVTPRFRTPLEREIAGG